MVRVAKNLFGMVDGIVWIVALVTLMILIAVTVWLEKTHPLRNAVGGGNTTVAICSPGPMLICDSVFVEPSKYSL